MSRDEQATFVGELSISVIVSILDDIEEGKVPDEWDGVELRQLLAERFSNEHYWGMISPRRKKEYRNAMMVNNL